MAVAAAAWLCPAGFGGPYLHVNDDALPGGDGASWDTALRFLQDALAVASDPSNQVIQIRLAAGIYHPDRSEAAPGGTGDRRATFQLISGVILWGGFPGSGGGAANPDLYPTILSGDLLGDDGESFANNGDNSYHVVTASGVDDSDIVGVTITAGNADGQAQPFCFGGLNHGSECAVAEDCEFGTCVSPDSLGAGIYAVNGRPGIVDCRIVGNFAAFQAGGLLLKGGGDAMIANCTFSGNRALDNGGAMYLGHSSPTVFNCTFIGNSGGRYAGASCNRDHSNAMFINCVFENNTAAETGPTGGGAIVNASSSPTFTNCTFTGNEAFQGDGGAIYNKVGFIQALGTSDPVLTNCTFQANSAGRHGGAAYSANGNSTLTGCTFLENESSAEGGALYLGYGQVALTDCQFTENTAAHGSGGAIYAQGSVELTDCDFQDNLARPEFSYYYSRGAPFLRPVPIERPMVQSYRRLKKWSRHGADFDKSGHGIRFAGA